MALVGGTQILVLDEPTKGLKKTRRAMIWDILADLKLEKTILVATSDPEEANRLATKLCIL